MRFISYSDARDIICRHAIELAPTFADRFSRWPDESTAKYLSDELAKKVTMWRNMGINDIADEIQTVIDQMKIEVQ